MLGDSSPSASPSNPKSKSHPSRATTSKANRAMDEDTEMDIEGVFSSGPGGSEAGEPEDMDSKSTSNSNSASRFFRAGGGAWVSANDPGPQPRSPSPFLSSETVDRANATSFRLLGERMALAERQYAQQYAGLYFIRLALLKKRVERAARRKWADLPGGQTPQLVPRVLDLPQNALCYMIGTIYIDMPLKPNILDEVTAEHYVVAPPPRPKYLSDRDTVTLEDESGRISLTAESSALIRKQGLVTGVVCALLGREGDKGEFEVLDVCYPEWSDDSDSASIPRGLPITSNSRRYVALVSGLNVSHKDSSLLNSELLVDFLSGGLGSSSSRIVRTIIAGNSVGRQPALFSGLSVSIEPGQSTTRTKKTAAQAAAEEANNPLKVLDALLSGLAANMEIDIMPGEKDPATYSMPQQHMLPALLPHTTRYTETVSMRTNPYECELEGCRILGTSGQPIDDIYKYVESESRLQIAENTLDWANIAPTAPDTLYAYPFKNIDPFVLQSLPDLYFVGNQPAFATSVWKQRTRVVLVPDFSKTGEIMLVEIGGQGRVGECICVKVATEGFDAAGNEA